MPEQQSWGDWRTDTAQRALTPVGGPPRDDRTRAMAPIAAVVEPSSDLPRAPRWPLYADETTSPAGSPGSPTGAGPTPLGAAAVRRRHPVLPWVAAAVAVAVAAGAGGVAAAGASDPLTASARMVGDTDALSPSTGAGSSTDAVDTGTPRSSGSSRGDGAGRAPGRATAEPRSVVDETTAAAPSTAPPNVDLSGERVTYDAANLLDGRPETAWRTAGDARDTVLTLRLAEPTEITTVGMLNGYAKAGSAGDRDVDWYAANRRVRRVEWFFDDGSRVVQSLRDTTEVQRTDIRPTTTSTVRVRLSAVSPPGRGRDGRDFTAVSEIELDGVPARAGRD